MSDEQSRSGRRRTPGRVDRLWRRGQSRAQLGVLSMRSCASCSELENDETLLVQSGKPVAVFRTHEYAPRVLIANSNLVGAWANWETFMSSNVAV